MINFRLLAHDDAGHAAVEPSGYSILILMIWPLLALAGLIGYVLVSKKQGKPVSKLYVGLLLAGLLALTAAIFILP